MAETTALDALTAEERSLRALLRDGMREGYTGNDISNLLEVIDALRTLVAKARETVRVVQAQRDILLAQQKALLTARDALRTRLAQAEGERDAARAQSEYDASCYVEFRLADRKRTRELVAERAARAESEARVRALVAALTHVRACATCSELDWAECGDGRDALALLEETR